MTEAEKHIISEYIGDILVADEMDDFNTLYDTALKILELCAPDTEREVDDWCESIEARIVNLEKRVSMLNAFCIMKEADDNERRKARAKLVHVCRRYRERTSHSRTKAYQIIKVLNKELDKSGYSVQRGRVPKHYFMERFGLEKRR